MGLSTHILDTSLGRPAAGMSVILERETGASWTTLNRVTSDEDGRCKSLLPESQPLEGGVYRLRFATAAYFASRRVLTLYPCIDIIFEVTSPEEHYHIPLLLTANGYTTYRGS